MRLLAIDPGPKESAFVVWDGKQVDYCATVPNDDLRQKIAGQVFSGVDDCAIEMVACYGMPVGKETFETCVWIGRFMECLIDVRILVRLVYRKDVKMHLCGSMRAKDGNIRQALIDKLGAVGTKKNPGPLYGVSGHLWAALAVADYSMENL